MTAKARSATTTTTTTKTTATNRPAHHHPHCRKTADTVSFEHKERYVDNKGMDRIMTPVEYKATGRQLCSTLRSPHDPAPRLVAHGSGPWNTPCTNVRELLKRHAAEGATLVRGYRLLTVPITKEEQEQPETPRTRVWKAVFHAVVAHPPKNPTASDKWIYECATAPEDIADRKHDFLFVPSSRAHCELTDEQLLTGDWLLGIVIGGDKLFCDVVAADNATRGRERSMVCVVPENCIAKRKLVFGYFPHFSQWFRQEPRHMSPESMAELMGFPCVDAAEKVANPSMDYFDDEHLQASIDRNTSALVDGGQASLRLEYESQQALLQGRQSFEHTRAKWLNHYDELFETIEKVTEQRYQAALAQRNLR